jgi:hypothetical protein
MVKAAGNRKMPDGLSLDVSRTSVEGNIFELSRSSSLGMDSELRVGIANTGKYLRCEGELEPSPPLRAERLGNVPEDLVSLALR